MLVALNIKHLTFATHSWDTTRSNQGCMLKASMWYDDYCAELNHRIESDL